MIEVLPPTKFITGTIKYPNGNPVTNAIVYASKSNGYASSSAFTNGTGSFSIPVDSGNWFISVNPRYDIPFTQFDWVYRNTAQTVEVDAQDGNYPSGGLNLVVVSSNATVTGKVYVGPSGTTAPSIMSTSVFLYEKYGMGYSSYAPLNPDGSYTMKVPAGSYQFSLNSAVYNIPEERTVNLVAGTNNLGITRIFEKTEFITGRVLNENGQGAEGINVYAYREGGSGYANTITNDNGNYSLGVTSGEWVINVAPNTQANLYYMGGQVRQSISTGQTLTGVDFVMQKATGHVTGRMIDSEGNLVTSIGAGYVSANSLTFYQGAPIANGLFNIDLVPGGYNFTFSLPPGAPYFVNDVNWVVIDGNQTVDFIVSEADGTLTGSIKDAAGNVITGLQGGVNITDRNGKQLWASFDSSTGTYEIPIVSGTDWFMTVWLPSNTKATNGKYYTYEGGRITASTVPGVNTQDIVLSEANCIIKGRVTRANGTPLQYAQVYLNEFSATNAYAADNFSITDSNGLYSLRVPAGTYTVGVGQTSETESAGEMIPMKARLTVGTNNSPLIHDFKFIQATRTISGDVLLDSSGVRAYVWAWSDKGRNTNATSNADGSYVLNVTDNDIWHVGASMETWDVGDHRISYRSDVLPGLELSGENVTQDINLNPLPSSLTEELSVTFPMAEPKTVVLADGTRIDIPAGALGQGPEATLVATPKMEYPRSSNMKPIDLAYDLAVYDALGRLIKTFSSNVSLTFSYTDQQLIDLAITEDQLVVSYWDESTSTWKISPNFSVDTGQNKITVLTDHFSQWMIGANIMLTTVDVGPDKTGYANIPLKLTPTVTDNGSGISSYSWQAVDLDLQPQGLPVVRTTGDAYTPLISLPTGLTFSSLNEKDTTVTVNRAGHFGIALVVQDGDENIVSDVFDLTVTNTPEKLPVSTINPQFAYVSSVGGWNVDATKEIVSGDFNGDGKADVAAIYDYGYGKGGGNGQMGIWGFLSDGVKMTPKSMFISKEGFWNMARTRYIFAGDFNRDGKTEIAAVYDYSDPEHPGKMGIWLFEFNGSTMVPRAALISSNNFWNFLATKGMIAGDFNKDGRTDIAAMYDYGNGKIGIWNFQSNGTTFAPKNLLLSANGFWNVAATKGMVAGDFNKDGKVDLAALYDYGMGKIGIWSFESNGITMKPRAILISNYGFWNVEATKFITAGDFNKDGKLDIAAFYDYGNGKVGIWNFQSNGLTMAPKALYTGAYGNWVADNTKFMVSGDFNRDGRSELAVMYDYGSNKMGIIKFQ